MDLVHLVLAGLNFNIVREALIGPWCCLSIQMLQDGSTDRNEDEEDEGEEKSGGEAEAVDKLSDVSSSNEAEEDVPNQCLSQFVKVCYRSVCNFFASGVREVAKSFLNQMTGYIICSHVQEISTSQQVQDSIAIELSAPASSELSWAASPGAKCLLLTSKVFWGVPEVVSGSLHNCAVLFCDSRQLSNLRIASNCYF